VWSSIPEESVVGNFFYYDGDRIIEYHNWGQVSVPSSQWKAILASDEVRTDNVYGRNKPGAQGGRPQRRAASGAKARVLTTSGRCSDCCTPYVLASFTTNSSNPTWNLTPYQEPGKATPCAFWRLGQLRENAPLFIHRLQPG